MASPPNPADEVQGTDGLAWIKPGWPAPARVKAVSMLRTGGASGGRYRSLNLATHVGDEAQQVEANRQKVVDALGIANQPLWLQQVHGIDVCDAGAVSGDCMADGSYTDRANVVCAVLTADCLPILLCDQGGSWVAAVHAGWRGLAHGIVEQACERFKPSAGELIAWLGPAISRQAFEVGDEVRSAFLAKDQALAAAFSPHGEGHWMADLYQLARARLIGTGVNKVYGGQWCTHGDPDRFYSFRRDGVTGRMATMIWIQD